MEHYHLGQLVRGTITQLTDFGAFARLEDGIEGLIHVSELAEGRVTHPRNVVQEGWELTLRVIRIDPQRRRMGLSLKRAMEAAGRRYHAAAGAVARADTRACTGEGDQAGAMGWPGGAGRNEAGAQRRGEGEARAAGCARRRRACPPAPANGRGAGGGAGMTASAARRGRRGGAVRTVRRHRSRSADEPHGRDWGAGPA